MPGDCNHFDIILNNARALAGYEGTTSSVDLVAWECISTHYREVELSCPNEKAVKIIIDWSPAIEYARKCEHLYSRSDEERIDVLSNNPDFFQRTVLCSASIKFESDNPKRSPSDGSDLLQQLLYEIYVVANLSVPGCFNLYRSYIRAKGVNLDKDPFAQTEMGISEYFFEIAWHDSQEISMLKLEFLPFADVLNWYRGLQIGFKQVAKETAEKAVFTLLHLGRTSFLEPEATLWLARALEAMYETSPGGSFQLLNRRISALFSLDNKQQASIKKQLREFYNVRNSFAHGGGSICHPMANERWDPLVDNVFGRTIECNNVAGRILLCSVQELIRHGAVAFNFEERVSVVK